MPLYTLTSMVFPATVSVEAPKNAQVLFLWSILFSGICEYRQDRKG